MNRIKTDDTFDDINDFFKQEPSKDDTELMREIVEMQEKYDALEEEYQSTGKDLSDLKTRLADSWALKQISLMEMGGYQFKVVPYEDYSITRKGESDDVKERRILLLEPLLQELGLGNIVKRNAVSIHPQTLKATLKKIHKPDGQFRLDLEETLMRFPFINHHVGQVMQVKKVK